MAFYESKKDNRLKTLRSKFDLDDIQIRILPVDNELFNVPWNVFPVWDRNVVFG